MLFYLYKSCSAFSRFEFDWPEVLALMVIGSCRLPRCCVGVLLSGVRIGEGILNAPLKSGGVL